jgi:signal transduction histidine kinase
VENPIYPKQFRQETHGTGLQNLSKRFALLTGKQVSVKDDGETFRVILPLS